MPCHAIPIPQLDNGQIATPVPSFDVCQCPVFFSRNSLASLTLVAKSASVSKFAHREECCPSQGDPPRSGWFSSISDRWFLRIFSRVIMRSLYAVSTTPRVSAGHVLEL